MNNSKKLIIAIDGFSSCGKSTVAKDLAKKLNYIYIDSGAMYRAITLFCLNNNLIKENNIDESKLKSLINKIKISFKYNTKTGEAETFLNGNNVEDEIRNVEVSENVSPISKIKFVRKNLVKQQQNLGKNKAIVMDGRDIGTTVFPKADIKIFMTADVDVRAERRYKELTQKGLNVSLEEIKENIKKRDHLDQNREISPLRKADDAIILDNSYLTPSEQLSWILDKIEQKTLNFKL
ncbi:MAG: (d)CMP kinase [Bacteroidales bacterium]|nr:(d)CMP kinase [Bacteroidales bacterium]